MSDQTNTTAHDDNETQTPQQLREYAERKANEAKALQAEAEAGRAARRELAFIKAGIDLSSKATQRLMETYNGELDADSIVAFAEDLELPRTGASAETEAQGDPDEEARAQAQAAHLVREQARGGQVDPNLAETPKKPVVDAAYEDFYERMEKGESRKEAGLHVLGKIIQAGREGDEDVLWTGWSDEDIARAEAANR